MDMIQEWPWFDSGNLLISSPSSQMNRLHLTWEIVELSRLNVFRLLHTLPYDDAGFLRILWDAYRNYPDSPEFQIAIAFAGISGGQYYNGIPRLATIVLTIEPRRVTPMSSIISAQYGWISHIHLPSTSRILTSFVIEPSTSSGTYQHNGWEQPITSINLLTIACWYLFNQSTSHLSTTATSKGYLVTRRMPFLSHGCGWTVLET